MRFSLIVFAVMTAASVTTPAFAAPHSHHGALHSFATAAQASFVPPASPSRTGSHTPHTVTSTTNTQQASPLSTNVWQAATVPGYHSHQYTPTTATMTALFARKKKSNTPGTATRKVQVKLLKHVAGSGQAGEVILVSPAFYNNKLRPNQAAELISDEEVALEKAAAQLRAAEQDSKVQELHEKLSDRTFVLRRKAGPGGHLFGAVGSKAIMDVVQAEVKDDFIKKKFVKVSATAQEDGKKMRGDIKELGTYQVTIALGKGASVKVQLVVEEE